MALREETQVERVVDGFHDGLLLVELARVLNVKRAFCGMDRIDFVSGGGTSILSPPTTGAGEPEDDQLVTSATRCGPSGFRTLIFYLLEGCRQAYYGVKTVGGVRYVWVTPGSSTPLPLPSSWASFFQEHSSPLAYFALGAKLPHTWKAAVDACRDMLNGLVELYAFTTNFTYTSATNKVIGGHSLLPVETYPLAYYPFFNFAITPDGGHRHLPTGVSWGTPYLAGQQTLCKWYFEGREYMGSKSLSVHVFPFDKVSHPYNFFFLHGDSDTVWFHYYVYHPSLRARRTYAQTLAAGIGYHSRNVLGKSVEGYWRALGTLETVPDALGPEITTESGGFVASLAVSFTQTGTGFTNTQPVYRVKRDGDWTPYLTDKSHARLSANGILHVTGSVLFYASTAGTYDVRCKLTRVEGGAPPSVAARLTIGGSSAAISSEGEVTLNLSLAGSPSGTAHAYTLEFDDYADLMKDNAELETVGSATVYTEADTITAGQYALGGGDVYAQDCELPWAADEGPQTGITASKMCRRGDTHEEVYEVWSPEFGSTRPMRLQEYDLEWAETDWRPAPLVTETSRMRWKNPGQINVSFRLELA